MCYSIIMTDPLRKNSPSPNIPITCTTYELHSGAVLNRGRGVWIWDQNSASFERK